MHRTLPAIVTDLEIRATTLIESLSSNSPPEISSRISSVRMQVEMLRGEARALRESLAVGGDVAKQFDRHLDLSRLLRQFELFDAPLFLRWSEADRLITQMCDALLSQVGWPFDRPLIGGFSMEYYWAHPLRKIIGVPANEERRLLAIGDLAHELGHLAFAEDALQFAGPVLVEVARYVQGQLAAPPNDLPDSAVELLVSLRLSWRAWIQEFGCDAFATFLVGPAYAWQHLRLACMEDAAAMLFEPIDFGDHPADDARMRLMLMMLRQLGHDAQADEITAHWADLLAMLGATTTREYDAAYPDALLEAVAVHVKAVCEALGLRPYDAEAAETDVAHLANEAWERLRAAPDDYGEWERAALSASRVAWAG